MMSGFAGFCDYSDSLLEEKYLWMALARRMARRISHRGPEGRGAHVSAHCAAAQCATDSPGNAVQPMTVYRGGQGFTIVYDGKLSNAGELRRDMEAQGVTFETGCDAEVVLRAYLCYGEGCAEKLEGMFAFAVDDGFDCRTFFCRDRFGAKPLFYTFQNGRLAFGSEIKALFEYPGVNPVIGREGLCEVFGLGPFRTPGCGVFEGVSELKPGHTAVFERDGFREQAYFQLTAAPHLEDYPETVERVRELLLDAGKRVLPDDGFSCVVPESGPDAGASGALAALLASDGNRNLFPDCRAPEEVTLTGVQSPPAWGAEELADSLFEAVIARDLPGMADAGGSLFQACRLLGKQHPTALCGAAGGGLFGLSPWYHREGNFESVGFPWQDCTGSRAALLKPELQQVLRLEDYTAACLQETLDSVPVLRGESAQRRRMRRLSYLELTWFAASRFEFWDRCGMANGLEMRFPYADRRLVQYVFNIPWELKCPEGVPGGLLRDAVQVPLPAGSFPSEPRLPGYGQILRQRLTYILRDSLQPIHKVLSRESAEALLLEQKGREEPWFVRLMAYLIQVNYWLLHYDVYVSL